MQHARGRLRVYASDSRPPAPRQPVLIRALQWVGGHEAIVLASLTAIALAVAIFLKLASVVSGDSPLELDTRLILAMRVPGSPDDPIGPPWLEEAARDLTALGSATLLFLAIAAACCYLLLKRQWLTAVFVAGSTVGGIATSFLLKSGFDRPRPDLVAHEAEVFTSSFPSSHAMASAIVFLTLGALLARSQPSRPIRAYLLLLAAALTAVVGVSRVYLGVHWPTDVLAGWVAGGAWALGAYMCAQVVKRGYGRTRRGSVPSEPS